MPYTDEHLPPFTLTEKLLSALIGISVLMAIPWVFVLAALIINKLIVPYLAFVASFLPSVR